MLVMSQVDSVHVAEHPLWSAAPAYSGQWAPVRFGSPLRRIGSPNRWDGSTNRWEGRNTHGVGRGIGSPLRRRGRLTVGVGDGRLTLRRHAFRWIGTASFWTRGVSRLRAF
jgi:hypothetical protein